MIVLVAIRAIPYILIFASELVEAVVCSVNWVQRYIVNFFRNKNVKEIDRRYAKDKLITEWREVGIALKDMINSFR